MSEVDKYTVVVGNEDCPNLYACFFEADSEEDAKSQMVEVGIEDNNKITMVFPPKDLSEETT